MKKYAKFISLLLVLALIISIVIPSLSNIVLAEETKQKNATKQTEQVDNVLTEESKSKTLSIFGMMEDSTSGESVVVGGGTTIGEGVAFEDGSVALRISSDNYNPKKDENFNVIYSVSTNSFEVENMVVSIELPSQIEIVKASESNPLYNIEGVLSKDAVDGKTIYNITFLGNVVAYSKFDFAFELKIKEGDSSEFIPVAKVKGNTSVGDINIETKGEKISVFDTSKSDYEEGTGNFSIVNFDQDGGLVAGVVYEIRKNDEVIETITTNEKGKVVCKNVLDPGKYQLVQISAPEGIAINNEPLMFEIFEDIESHKLITHSKSDRLSRSYDPPQYQYISTLGHRILSVDEETGAHLAGAVYLAETAPNAFFVGTYVSGPDGYVTVTHKFAGGYTLRDKFAPYGYMRDKKMIIYLASPDGKYILPETYKFKRKTATFDIFVTDDDKVRPVPLANATFEVRDKADNILVDTITTNAEGKVMASGYKEKPLHLRFNDMPDLKPGTYTFKQISAPDRHIKDEKEYEVTITGSEKNPYRFNITNKRIKANFEIFKRDVNGNPLSGAVFEIKDQYGTLVETITSRSDGKATTTVMLGPGGYTITETVAPVGQVLNIKPIPFIISKPTSYVKLTVINAADVGTLGIIKKDTLGNFLSGAVFSVTNVEGVHARDITTGVDGKVSVSDLPPGTYKFKEIKAPNGYSILDGSEYVFPITNVRTNVLNLDFVNAPVAKAVKINKINNLGEPLQGAQFQLKQGATVIENLVTDVNGVAINSYNLPVGNYELVETVASAGHELNSTPIPVEITDAMTGPVVKTVVNVKKVTGKGHIQVTATEKDKPTIMIVGAKFEILSGTTLVGTIETDGAGIAKLENLTAGEYTVKQISAPNKYKIDPTIQTFKLGENDVKEVTFRNEKVVPNVGSIKISVTDSDNIFIPIVGANFEITSSKSRFVQTITTDSLGIAKLENLSIGDYTIRQTSAPTGYTYDATLKHFSIDGNDVREINFKNQKVVTPKPNPVPSSGGGGNSSGGGGNGSGSGNGGPIVSMRPRPSTMPTESIIPRVSAISVVTGGPYPTGEVIYTPEPSEITIYVTALPEKTHFPVGSVRPISSGNNPKTGYIEDMKMGFLALVIISSTATLILFSRRNRGK